MTRKSSATASPTTHTILSSPSTTSGRESLDFPRNFSIHQEILELLSVPRCRAAGTGRPAAGSEPQAATPRDPPRPRPPCHGRSETAGPRRRRASRLSRNHPSLTSSVTSPGIDSGNRKEFAIRLSTPDRGAGPKTIRAPRRVARCPGRLDGHASGSRASAKNARPGRSRRIALRTPGSARAAPRARTARVQAISTHRHQSRYRRSLTC